MSMETRPETAVGAPLGRHGACHAAQRPEEAPFLRISMQKPSLLDRFVHAVGRRERGRWPKTILHFVAHSFTPVSLLDNWLEFAQQNDRHYGCQHRRRSTTEAAQ